MAQYSEDPIENIFRKYAQKRVAGPPLQFSRWMLFIGMLLLGIGIFAFSAVGMYTDWLWFVHDAQQPFVFTKSLITKWGLGLVGFLISFLVLNFALYRSVKIVKASLIKSANLISRMTPQLIQLIQEGGQWLSMGIAGLIAWFFGMAFANHYDQWWWFTSAVDFGKKDPLFNIDLGFYVFHLPWIQFFLSSLFFLSLLVSIIIFGTRILLASLAQLTGIDIQNSFNKRDLIIPAGITIVLYAAVQWFARFDMGTIQEAQFTGPGYAYSQQLIVNTAFTLIAFILGIAILLSGIFKPNFRIVTASVSILSVLWLSANFLIVPSIQRFVVEPNKLAVEKPYVEKAMSMTRFAYHLDHVRVKDFNVQSAPTPQQVAEAESTLQNMRLWDPTVLKSSIDGLQSLQPYYDFSDVDTDRYIINGKKQMVMLSARNVDVSGLPSSARSWVPSHLQYTHGYGLMMAPVNQSTSSGQPTFYIQDMPVQSKVGIKVDQPRVYFSDYRRNGVPYEPVYSLVNTSLHEFDYPTQDSEQTCQWNAKRGVPVGGWLSRIAHSIHLTDGNLLISPNITPETKLIYRRNIINRVKRIFPLFDLDHDPYLVLLNGKMIWMMDAYLTSNTLPYSSIERFKDKEINYIRNCAKITIDAYSGELKAYAIDEKEPMTQAYMKMFPGLLRPSSEASNDLKSHYRYGEDLFAVQADVIRTYHVTRTDAFLNNEDVWQVPTELGTSSESQPMPPYYVQMRLPDEKKDSFMLILPFTPRKKNNMIGWMAAHCDPDNYGEVVLYRFQKNSQTPGPNQMEAIFNQDSNIAQINREFNNDQSTIIPGNLLVIPIGSSILYVKPLFLQTKVSQIRPIPELKKVVLALQDKVVVADSYPQALERLFGTQNTASMNNAQAIKPVHNNAASKAGEKLTQIKQALQVLEQSENALRQGNFAQYGELQKKLKEILSPEGDKN